MMNARLIWFATLLIGTAIATYAFGWLAVPVCAGAWAWIRRDDPAVPLMAAFAAMAAWAFPMIVGHGGANVAKVAEVVGAAMQVGPMPLVVLTLAFPALLAGSAAGVVRGAAARAK